MALLAMNGQSGKNPAADFSVGFAEEAFSSTVTAAPRQPGEVAFRGWLSHKLKLPTHRVLIYVSRCATGDWSLFLRPDAFCPKMQMAFSVSAVVVKLFEIPWTAAAVSRTGYIDLFAVVFVFPSTELPTMELQHPEGSPCSEADGVVEKSRRSEMISVLVVINQREASGESFRSGSRPRI